jgi:hypothetical protein
MATRIGVRGAEMAIIAGAVLFLPIHLLGILFSGGALMTRHFNPMWTALAVVGIVAAGARRSDGVVVRYNVSPQSTYKYLPSGFGPGIPGGMPSAYELDFGVGGSFDLDFDDAAVPPAVKFINLNLVLTGNETIQANPPGFQPVTADRVEDWLAMHLLVNVPSVALYSGYRDPDVPNMILQNWGSFVRLEGGFNNTPVDGTGMLFSLEATPVPEPTAWAAGIMAAGALGGVTRRKVLRLRR